MPLTVHWLLQVTGSGFHQCISRMRGAWSCHYVHHHWCGLEDHRHVCVSVSCMHNSVVHTPCLVHAQFSCAHTLPPRARETNPMLHTTTRWMGLRVRCRDGNSGTGTRYPLDTRPDGYRYGDDFLSVGGTRTQPESRRVRGGYFFPPTGNSTGTRYFTTVMILRCEQVKMCSFCDINYDLFWLLNFATRLSKIFVEY
jgi:hypothetical protein